MAEIEFIIPGSGIINDTEEDAEIIIPGVGIYNEQASPGGNLFMPEQLGLRSMQGLH